jgi:glutamyl-Q tRNA(Asp) synthetase
MASYIGRFAPSPTGPLHIGSLFSALASYLDARAHKGKWLLRMEDIDPPREMPGAADTILHQLEQHGLYWDGPVLYQSQRSAAYQRAIKMLSDTGLLYPCDCSRARLRTLGGVYDGHCHPTSNQSLNPPSKTAAPISSAIRIDIQSAGKITWQDLFQGSRSDDLIKSTGDFVIVRRDKLVAYQLAVSVDDAHQGITHVIRGSDLLTSTSRQIYLLEQLGQQVPTYGHVSVINNSFGNKLSKQSFAPAAAEATPGANLEHCLALLNMTLPANIKGAPIEDILLWASQNWQRSKVPTAPLMIDDT